MKKLILFAAILFAGASVAKAQVVSLKSDVTLKVELKPIQTILVNSDDRSAGISLIYKTVDDYNKGVTESRAKHLSIYSTGGFTVNVNAESGFLGDNTKKMMLNTIKIAAADISANTFTTTPTITPVELSLKPKALIASTEGGFDQSFDVSYTGGKQFRDLYKEGESNIFTTIVTYTLSPN